MRMNMRHGKSGTGYGNLLVAAAAALLLSSCELLSGPGEEPRLERLPRDLSAAEQAVIRSSNTIAFGILRETAERDTSQSIMLSPLSATIARGMAMNGARGPTFEGMRAALGFDSLDQAQINVSYRELIDLLLDLDDAVDMRIANSVWARSGFAFHDSFMETVRHSFGAEVTTLDFDAVEAAPTINGWVDRSTNGRITEIVDAPIPADAVMYLINAIYFKGDWQERFDANDTRDATFTRADGTTKTVQMMSREGGFEYHADADAEIAQLRYSRGAFVMNIMLPRAGRTVDELIATLDAARWSAWMDGL